MTLDEYLADVDRWKAEAQAELDSLSDEQRKATLWKSAVNSNRDSTNHFES